LPEGQSNQTLKLVSNNLESQSLQININISKQCDSDTIKYGEQCGPQSSQWSDYFDLTCNCYKNVPYVENDNISWIIDNGFINTNQVNRSFNLYMPAVPNGELILFAHPVGETKEMNGSFSQPLLAGLLQEGYAVASIEFRHPIMERALITNISQDQWDLILALKMIRQNLNFMGVSSVGNISAIAHSKGSLILANLLTSNSLLSDNQGFLTLKKIYLYDSQITYNLDTHYSLFTGTQINPICYLNLGFGCLVDPFSPYQALVYFNNLFDSAGGMALTTNLNVIDSYRSVTDSSLMNNLNNTRTLPIIRFAFNQPNVGKRSPQLLINGDLSLNYAETDYLIHNPLSIDHFCNNYNNYVNNGCSGSSSYNFNINNVLSDIMSFF
jgi:hypothetical protein